MCIGSASAHFDLQSGECLGMRSLSCSYSYSSMSYSYSSMMLVVVVGVKVMVMGVGTVVAADAGAMQRSFLLFRFPVVVRFTRSGVKTGAALHVGSVVVVVVGL